MEEQNLLLKGAFEHHRSRQQQLLLVEGLLDLLAYVHEHRALCLPWIAGEAVDLTAQRNAIIDALRGIQSQREPWITEEDWQQMAANWFDIQYLRSNVTPEEAIERHQALITQILGELGKVPDGSSFESLPDSSRQLARLYLKELPDLLEALARIRCINEGLAHNGGTPGYEKLAEQLPFLQRFVSTSVRHIAYAFPESGFPAEVEVHDYLQLRQKIELMIWRGRHILAQLTEDTLSIWMGQPSANGAA